MPMVEFYYDGEPVQGFRLSDRELKVMAAEPGGARFILYKRLQTALPDLGIDDLGKFDYVVRLNLP